MPDTGSGSSPSILYAADRMSAVRSLAAQTLADLQQHDISPTPRNFELWFTHLEGSNVLLSKALTALLASGRAPNAADLVSLYSECIDHEVDVGSVSAHAEQLDHAAQAMVEHVAENQTSLHAFGDTLTGMTVQLAQDRTVDGLLRAVTVLTTETARASERNRVLEHQLSTSSSRINKLRQELVEVKQDATTDGLTGLCNRRAFDSRLRRAMGRARSEGEPMSLVLLDIDHFKRFNDIHGHRTGDLVLRLVARIISDNVKGRDTAARYGGEEFAIILAGANLSAAAIVARQVRAALDGKRLVIKRAQQSVGSVTVSAGVGQFRSSDTLASLVERADAALYEAKRLGRNQVCTEEKDAATAG